MNRRALPLWLRQIIIKMAANQLLDRLLGRMFRDGMPNAGCTVVLPGNRDLSGLFARCVYGLYEGGERRAIERYLLRECDTIELGASSGLNSALIASLLKPDARLLCLELDPSLATTWERNVAENSQGCAAQLVHGAILPVDSLGATIVHGESTVDGQVEVLYDGCATEGREVVPRVTLEELLDSVVVDDGINLVVDIEGAEQFLVEAEADVLQTSVRRIILEAHNVELGDRIVSVDSVLQTFEAASGLALLAREGAVAVFGRLGDGCEPCSEVHVFGDALPGGLGGRVFHHIHSKGGRHGHGDSVWLWLHFAVFRRHANFIISDASYRSLLVAMVRLGVKRRAIRGPVFGGGRFWKMLIGPCTLEDLSRIGRP